MGLPDNNFFELLRSVFGNIKTPFNKQRLLDDLGAFLSRKDIQKNISAYLNDEDKKIISALALLQEPSQRELEKFFTGEWTGPELHALLINLEERLVIYRFKDEGLSRLALNPLLAKVLNPAIGGQESLFPSVVIEGSVPPAPPGSGVVMDSRITAAVFAFVSSQEELFRIPGGMGNRGMELRKKVIDEGKKIFPGLNLAETIQTLVELELFYIQDRQLLPSKEKIESFSLLSSAERQSYWAAGLHQSLSRGGAEGEAEGEQTSAYGSGYSPGLSRSRLRGYASYIQRFRLLLEQQRGYRELSLRRLAELLDRDGGVKTWGSDLFNERLQIPFEALLSVLEKTGLIIAQEGYWYAPPVSEGSVKEGEPLIAMDTVFSFILYPEISFPDALRLGTFCAVKEKAGTAIRFELNRSSAVRGFDQAISSQEMTELLRRLSGNRLDESLLWALKEWEDRYEGVSLFHGTVLSLAEDRRYLAGTAPLSQLIQKTLAPGVYLLSLEDRAEAAALLKKAGVDIIAQPSQVSPRAKSSGPRTAFPPLAARTAETPKLPPREQEGDRAPEAEANGAEALKERFRQALEAKGLGKNEREELGARIERRLVLSETQLDGKSLRFEKLEARGLDFAGKSTVAKQAVDTLSLLEVSWPGGGGEIQRVIGKAQGLEKKEGELILVLVNTFGTSAAGEETQENIFTIPLSKISHLRRIKQSIFGV